MEPNLPANPMSIELTLSHRRSWWQVGDEDGRLERWDVSADVWELDLCPDEERHVGDIGLVITDLAGERTEQDAAVLGEWAPEFIAETVIDPARGRLHSELDSRIKAGPPRMVVFRRIELTEPWQGHGLGAALAASALRILTPTARLAACRVSPLEFVQDGMDRLSAELAGVRLGGMLERIGFFRWSGVYVVDLRNPALLDVRIDAFNQWWPAREGEIDQ